VRIACWQRSARQSSPASYRVTDFDASARIRFEGYRLDRSGRSGINRLDAGHGKDDDRENGEPDDRSFHGSWPASYPNVCKIKREMRVGTPVTSLSRTAHSFLAIRFTSSATNYAKTPSQISLRSVAIPCSSRKTPASCQSMRFLLATRIAVRTRIYPRDPADKFISGKGLGVDQESGEMNASQGTQPSSYVAVRCNVSRAAPRP